MLKHKWHRSNRSSVRLPRSEFIEIRPRMEDNCEGESRWGPQLTVDTLSPIGGIKMVNPDKGSEKLSTWNGCTSTPKKNAEGMKVNPAVQPPSDPLDVHFGRLLSVRKRSEYISEWDSRLLPFSEMNSMENEKSSSEKTLQSKDFDLQNYQEKPKLSIEVPKWDNPSGSINISSDKECSPDRSKKAIKKPLKLKIRQNCAKKSLRHKPFALQPSQYNPHKDNPLVDSIWSNQRSEDIVFHENLDNKISVKTVMPNAYSTLPLSGIWQRSSAANREMQTQWIAPQREESGFSLLEGQDSGLKDSRVGIEMPALLPLSPNKYPPRPKFQMGNQMLSTNSVPLTRKSGPVKRKRDAVKKSASKRTPQSAWHRENLCECSLREIPHLDPSQSSVIRWRSIEAICMRLRGLQVPGNLGLVKETPSFDDIFDVLGIDEQDHSQAPPKWLSNYEQDDCTDSENETKVRVKCEEDDCFEVC
ncbi:uncharacterized protein LOC108090665 [Drosophila ficusphila]|uniref:uncharacterized protein LOC108090665 n=1 Tax=Drosophila ficusphila TaxID=30025 RepID=UPI0007E6AE29|nr:uncharacterized protein LOC108090665 [Drosophila ficusphila]